MVYTALAMHDHDHGHDLESGSRSISSPTTPQSHSPQSPPSPSEKPLPTTDIHDGTSTSAEAESGPRQALNRPTTLQIISYSIALFLGPAFFIGLGGAAMAYHGTYHHAEGSGTAKKIFETLRVVPTLFPIIYAATVSWTLKMLALRSATQGTTLGALEQLLGSTTLGSTIATHGRLRIFKLSAVGLLLLWILSPIGGQASIRMFVTGPSERPTVNYGLTWYRHPQSESSFLTAMTVEERNKLRDIFELALRIPKSMEADLDPFSNLKIPSVEFLMQRHNQLVQIERIRREYKSNKEYFKNRNIKHFLRDGDTISRHAVVRTLMKAEETGWGSIYQPWLPALTAYEAGSLLGEGSRAVYDLFEADLYDLHASYMLINAHTHVYVSLIGLPILPPSESEIGRGRHETSLDTAYFVLNCTKLREISDANAADMLKPFYPGLQSPQERLEALNNGGFVFAPLENNYGARDQDLKFAELRDVELGNSSSAVEPRIIDFIAQRHGSQDEVLEGKKMEIYHSSCLLKERRLSVNVHCMVEWPLTCKPVEVMARNPKSTRSVRHYTPSTNGDLNVTANLFDITPFDGGGSLSQNFFSAFSTVGVSGNQSTIAHIFLAHPDTVSAAEQSRGYVTTDLADLEPGEFTARLSLLMNTYWAASFSPDAITDSEFRILRMSNALDTVGRENYSSPSVPYESPDNITQLDGGLKRSANIDAPFLADSAYTDTYLYENSFERGPYVWIVLYFLSTATLLLVSITGLYLYITNTSPDVFGHPVSMLLTADCKEPTAGEAGGNHSDRVAKSVPGGVDSSERARMVKDVYVRIVDSKPTEKIGHVSLFVESGVRKDNGCVLGEGEKNGRASRAGREKDG